MTPPESNPSWPLWIAEFNGTILPIAFWRPVSRLEVVDLVTEANEIAAVTWMSEEQAHEIAHLILHCTQYGDPVQRVLAVNVGLADPQAALEQLWRITHPQVH